MEIVCKGRLTALISLACVSSETRNLQRVFRPRRGEGGGGPFTGYIGMCRAKRYGFLAVLV